MNATLFKKKQKQKKNSLFFFVLFCQWHVKRDGEKQEKNIYRKNVNFFFKGRDKIEFSLVFLFLKFNITGGDEEHWGIIPFSFLPTEKREK